MAEDAKLQDVKHNGGVDNDADAIELRALAAQVQQSVEAKIRGEQGASQRLLSAVEELRSREESPMMDVFRLIFTPIQSTCAIIAIELGIVKALANAIGPIEAADIAKRSSTDELLVVRLMRVLSTMGIGEEIGLKTYRSNARAEGLNSEDAKAGLYLLMWTGFPAFGKVVDYIRDHKSFPMFPDRSTGQDLVQFATGMTAFQFYEKNPEAKAFFDKFVGGRRPEMAPHWFDTYPAHKRLLDGPPVQPGDALIVDVGGMLGVDIIRFKKKHPELPGRFIFQDLPETLDRLQPGDLPGDVEAMKHDFFTPQPVKGAKAYFFRSVFHDWPPEDCRKILRHTVAAMTEHSHVLIEEYVMPERNAPLHGAIADANMMLSLAGMERTLEQWTTLLGAEGLKIVGIWPPMPGAGSSSVIEARLSASGEA